MEEEEGCKPGYSCVTCDLGKDSTSFRGDEGTGGN